MKFQTKIQKIKSKNVHKINFKKYSKSIECKIIKNRIFLFISNKKKIIFALDVYYNN